MVVSKRCKICTALHPENIPIAGEYFGKVIPTLVERICGIVLDERKINGVLICLHCVIELVYTDVVIDKLRCSVQRLQKTIKPKTPSKEVNKVAAKDVKKMLNGAVSEETQSKTNNGTEVSNPTDIVKLHDKKVEKKTPKKVEKSKVVFLDKVTSSHSVETDSLFGTKTPKTAANPKSESIEDSATPDNADASEFKKISESPLVKKTSRKVAKRKPPSIEDALSPDATEDDGDENQSIKRYKTYSLSVTDQNLMDMTTDEQDLDVTNTEETSLNKDNTKKVLNCVICGKSFSKKSALRDHIDACHMGERLKECPNCSTEFRSQQKYESHVFNEKCLNALHVCQFPKCNKRFKTVHKMELHMQDKHSSQNDMDSDN